MNHDLVLRRVLVAGALFNFAAAAMVLFPRSLGRVADVPLEAPLFYSWLLAAFIALFGGVYLWLSRRPVIDRPLVGIAAIGKMGVFSVALLCLLLDEISLRGFTTAVVDLLFGLVFFWWLRRGASKPTGL